VRLVGCCIHQFVIVLDVLHLDFENPATAVRVGVDEGWIRFHTGIHFHDGSGEGGIDVTRGLYGFHHGGWISSVHSLANGWKLYEDHIGEFFLSVIGDANGGDVTVQADPFMGGNVADIGWDVHVKLLVQTFCGQEKDSSSFIKRFFHDLGRKEAPTDIDIEFGAEFCIPAWQVSHGNTGH